MLATQNCDRTIVMPAGSSGSDCTPLTTAQATTHQGNVSRVRFKGCLPVRSLTRQIGAGSLAKWLIAKG